MPQKVIPHLSFTTQDKVIDYVNSFNFLGITSDCHLTWKSHICNLSIKLSRISGSKEESLLVVDPFGRKSNKYSSTHPQQPMF